MEIWSSQFSVMMACMANIGAHGEDVAAIGITNQRETAIVWDKATGCLCIMPSCGSAGGRRI